MIRWGQIEKPLNIKATAESIYRPDLYREAAKALGVAYPTIDYKSEGTNSKIWTLNDATSPIQMGSDLFFDGKIFDPKKIVEYISNFDVKSLKFNLA